MATLTKIQTHWHGMGITEFVEDDATVFVPLWANGCDDAHSIASTPRFDSLNAATVAVDSMFAFRFLMDAHRAQQRAERQGAPGLAAPVALVHASLDNPDESTCWECGLPIAEGQGVMDEPMGWAHRSCVGA